MDNADWNSVLQFVADPLDLNYAEKLGDQGSSSGSTQVPTPPVSPIHLCQAHQFQTICKESHDGSPLAEPPEPNALVSVSTTFFPGAHLNSMPPDVALLSSDDVFFYVHTTTLLTISTNNFNSFLPAKTPARDQDPVVRLDETSAVLNAILHTLYDMSCAHYSPAFETLSTTVKHLPVYGIDPKAHITPNRPLFALLFSYAPLFPLELYALAATSDLHELAVATSTHLLSFPLATLTDEMAQRIGPIYLKKLFFLHFGRADALKRVLLPPPPPHPPTPWCDLSEQKKLTRAWALASAYLAWDARPGDCVSLWTSFPIVTITQICQQQQWNRHCVPWRNI